LQFTLSNILPTVKRIRYQKFLVEPRGERCYLGRGNALQGLSSEQN